MSTSYGRTELTRLLRDLIHHRAPTSDIDVVIRAGADPNVSIKDGLRPLHYAAYDDYRECIRYLIDKGADVNLSDDMGYTPLHIASKHGQLEVCRILISNGSVVNFDDDGPDSKGNLSKTLSSLTVNPLSLALENDHADCAELMLQNGANPNTKYFLGYEINMIPMENTSCLDMLLDHGADPDSFSRSGLTPLMKACKVRCRDAVRTLLRHGASVNLQCPPRFDEKTALHFAVTSGDADIVSQLLAAGAVMSRMPEYPYTPLEEAVTSGNLEAARVLLEFGADPNELNEERCCALQAAVSTIGIKHEREILELLLQHGADPNYHRSTFSYVGVSLSPIVEYFTYRDEFDIAVVKLLVYFGAKINLTRPTKLLKIRDGFGILNQIRKLRPYDDIFRFIVDVAGVFSTDLILKESSLSNGQREVLLELSSVPRDLKHLARLRIREILKLPVPPSATNLPLPEFLKQYILFQV